MPKHELAHKYNKILESSALSERLSIIGELCRKPIFTTGFGREEQVLLWHIYNEGLPVRIAMLQTGQLSSDILSLLNITRERYGLQIEEVSPNAIDVCKSKPPFRPLDQALRAADGWITGQTRAQSTSHSNIPLAQWDDQHHIMTFNPLADMAPACIDADIAAHEIPANPTHNKLSPSKGQVPCARAVKDGEHAHDDRWWRAVDASQDYSLPRPRLQAAAQF